MTFKELNITEPILKAIEEKGYAVPTPIQGEAIPAALAKRDILGCAQTGTGKTASFAIPIIQHLQMNKEAAKCRGIKALILTPTRELALQISECINDYAKYTQVRHGVIFGGVNQRPQVDMLHKGIDILVATPGRLLDLMNQGQKFDEKELVERAIESLNEKLRVSQLYLSVITGQMEKIKSKAALISGEAFKVDANQAHYEKIDAMANDQVKYDLLGKLTDATNLTRQAVAQIQIGRAHV